MGRVCVFCTTFATAFYHLIRSNTILKLCHLLVTQRLLNRHLEVYFKMQSIENKLAFLKDYKRVPSGNQKFYTHLWSLCLFEHLGQIQVLHVHSVLDTFWTCCCSISRH